MSTEPDERSLYIAGVREAVRRILEYTKEGQAAFRNSEIIRDAVATNLLRIGEASKYFSAETETGEGPWDRFAKIGDEIAYEYWNVDPERMWQVVERDLPGLQEVADRMGS